MKITRLGCLMGMSCVVAFVITLLIGTGISEARKLGPAIRGSQQ